MGTPACWSWTFRMPQSFQGLRAPPSTQPGPHRPCQGSLCSLNSHFLPFPSAARASTLGYNSASSPYPEKSHVIPAQPLDVPAL